MAILKVMPRKGTTKAIRAYLERDGRSLACDTNFCEQGQDWAHEMQLAIDSYEAMTGRGGGRSYYHVVISPDPRDGCDLAMTRELATRWAKERYPDARWAIEYHDDNGIVHAHVVICAALATGGKVHFTREGLRGDMDALQDICREMGLTEVPQETRHPRRTEDGYVVREGTSGRDRADGARPPGAQAGLGWTTCGGRSTTASAGRARGGSSRPRCAPTASACA